MWNRPQSDVTVGHWTLVLENALQRTNEVTKRTSLRGPWVDPRWWIVGESYGVCCCAGITGFLWVCFFFSFFFSSRLPAKLRPEICTFKLELHSTSLIYENQMNLFFVFPENLITRKSWCTINEPASYPSHHRSTDFSSDCTHIHPPLYQWSPTGNVTTTAKVHFAWSAIHFSWLEKSTHAWPEQWCDVAYWPVCIRRWTLRWWEVRKDFPQ